MVITYSGQLFLTRVSKRVYDTFTSSSTQYGYEYFMGYTEIDHSYFTFFYFSVSSYTQDLSSLITDFY